MHIVQRGHNRQDCFLHETDYLVYLANLHELTKKTGCSMHAYCLMTNHVHLLLTPPDAQACARLMRNLGQRYVQYFNRRHRRRGTLWEGRFKSCLVDSAQYVVAAYRYVERNPVRAGIVRAPADYRWSSHVANIGQASSTFLTPHAEYLALGSGDGTPWKAYQSLFSKDDEPGFLAALRDATNGGFALAGEQLRSTLPANLQQRLTRRPSGPRPGTQPQTHQVPLELELELGLRPRTG